MTLLPVVLGALLFDPERAIRNAATTTTMPAPASSRRLFPDIRHLRFEKGLRRRRAVARGGPGCERAHRQAVGARPTAPTAQERDAAAATSGVASRRRTRWPPRRHAEAGR